MRLTWTSGWESSGRAYRGVTLRLGPEEEQVWGTLVSLS